MDSPAQPTERRLVVGFWWRLLADTLDVLLLGVVGFSLAFVLRGLFYQLGERGWWVGLIVTFLYTGTLHTAVGQGQTLAKRLLGMQVIKQDGSFMSWPESFLRYGVIAFIAYNGWIGLGLTAMVPALKAPAFGTIYGLFVLACACGVVLVVSFHPLKQGLHDLIVNTVVVRKGQFSLDRLEALRDPRKARRAYTIASVAFLCLAVVFLWFAHQLPKLVPQLDQLTRIQHIIQDSTGFQNVGVTINTFQSDIRTQAKTTSIIVSGFLPKPEFDNRESVRMEAKQVAEIVRKELSDMQPYDFLTVTARSGFNIGIANLNFKQSFRFSPDGQEQHAQNDIGVNK